MNELEKYPHPFVTVDIVLFSIIDGKLSVCLSKRDEEPFKDVYSLPGTFIHENESAEGALLRLLTTKLGLSGKIPVEQFNAFTDINRDPRGRVISIPFYAIVSNYKDITPNWAKWFNIEETSFGYNFKNKDETFLEDALGFDHKEIIEKAVQFMQKDLENTFSTKIFEFLINKNSFTAANLREVFKSAFLNSDKDVLLNRGNFKKYILDRYESLGIIAKNGKEKASGKGRPSDLYKLIK